MVPNNLTIAVFRGCDFSGYSEAYEAGAVYSSKIRVSAQLLNTEGFAQAVLHSINATEKAINNGQSHVEVVLVDVDQDDRVWAHLHDYLRREKQYKPDVSLDINGAERESTASNFFSDKRFKRAWVNQPSTSQPWHQHHGQKVLVVDTGEASVAVYFTEGPIISGIAPRNVLSIGSWPAPKTDTLVTGTGHVVKKFPSNEDHFIAIDTSTTSVEAKGNAKEVLDTLSEHYSTAQLREAIEIYELGRKCQLHMVITPE